MIDTSACVSNNWNVKVIGIYEVFIYEMQCLRNRKLKSDMEHMCLSVMELNIMYLSLC